MVMVGGRSLLLLCFGQLLLLLLDQQLGSVSLLFVTHPVVFSAEPVSAETALELPVPSVHHVMPLQVLGGGEPLGTLAAGEPLLTLLLVRPFGRRRGTASCRRPSC